MDFGSLNWLAVIVASLVPMAVGFVWYGPLFGKKWRKLMGYTEESIKEDFNPMKHYGVPWVFSLIAAVVLGLLLHAGGVDGMGGGMMWGALLWIGILVPYAVGPLMFEKRNKEVFCLSVGHNFVNLLLMGLILGAWH